MRPLVASPRRPRRPAPRLDEWRPGRRSRVAGVDGATMGVRIACCQLTDQLACASGIGRMVTTIGPWKRPAARQARLEMNIGARVPRSTFRTLTPASIKACSKVRLQPSRKATRSSRQRSSAPSHSHDSSGNDAPSLISNPATPAKAGAHGKSGSRPSPGKRGGDVELHQLNESVH